MNTREDQKALWEKMTQNGKITHPDPFQSELELEFMLSNSGGKTLNVGCGCGYETGRCAEKTGFAVGVDFSEKMIEMAKRQEKNGAIFRVGDALNLEPIVEEFGLFDTVTTRRILINLRGWSDQRQAIEEMKKCLKLDGHLIMIEATEEGYQELNILRKRLGITEVKVINHNYPIPLKKLNVFMKYDWSLVKEDTMATYYFLTRVFYPLIEEPKYGSHFADQAAHLQRILGNINVHSPILMRLYCLRPHEVTHARSI